MANKKNILITLLIVIIIVMAAILAYIFLIRPGITGYAIGNQNQGIEFAISTIMQRAATCQQVPLISGNQTINIIAVECLPPELFQRPQEVQPQQ